MAGRQQGVALLTVLLVVFLATVAATALATLQQRSIQRSALLQHQQQARLYTLGAEQWAAAILARDRDDNAVDHLGEDWAALPPALPVDGGMLTGRIEDLQGRFNLNNLIRTDAATGQQSVDTDRLQQLQRLLRYLDIDAVEVPRIAAAIVDWVDDDREVYFPDGGEDSEYVGLTPGYQTANQPLLDTSELRLIRGIDTEIYDKLRPYVTALPTGTAINVNTAPAAVIATLADSLDLTQIEAVIDEREQQEFEDIAEFIAQLQLESDTIATGTLSVASDYFLIQVEAEVGEARARLTSVLSRSGDGQIMSRAFGNDN